MTVLPYLDNLRMVLAMMPEELLGEVLALVERELFTRMQLDAANYCSRALACLDVDRLKRRAAPATTEPSRTD